MLLIYLIGILKWVEFDVSIVHIGGMVLRKEQKVIVKCSS
jgi:hypothetical protein